MCSKKVAKKRPKTGNFRNWPDDRNAIKSAVFSLFGAFFVIRLFAHSRQNRLPPPLNAGNGELATDL
jgi:hypothetical protein